MSIDQSRSWITDGRFVDRNGTDVKAYDDVLLLADAASVSAGTVTVEVIPAGTVGTVIFVTQDEPTWLSLECDIDGGFAFAENFPAADVTLHRTAEKKRQNAAN
ncbi:MAG: hypothetical protein ABIO43_09180 [Sphingomicrobium sp.]